MSLRSRKRRMYFNLCEPLDAIDEPVELVMTITTSDALDIAAKIATMLREGQATGQEVYSLALDGSGRIAPRKRRVRTP